MSSGNIVWVLVKLLRLPTHTALGYFHCNLGPSPVPIGTAVFAPCASTIWSCNIHINVMLHFIPYSLAAIHERPFRFLVNPFCTHVRVTLISGDTVAIIPQSRFIPVKIAIKSKALPPRANVHQSVLQRALKLPFKHKRRAYQFIHFLWKSQSSLLIPIMWMGI